MDMACCADGDCWAWSRSVGSERPELQVGWLRLPDSRNIPANSRPPTNPYSPCSKAIPQTNQIIRPAKGARLVRSVTYMDGSGVVGLPLDDRGLAFGRSGF